MESLPTGLLAQDMHFVNDSTTRIAVYELCYCPWDSQKVKDTVFRNPYTIESIMRILSFGLQGPPCVPKLPHLQKT